MVLPPQENELSPEHFSAQTLIDTAEACFAANLTQFIDHLNRQVSLQLDPHTQERKISVESPSGSWKHELSYPQSLNTYEARLTSRDGNSQNMISLGLEVNDTTKCVLDFMVTALARTDLQDAEPLPQNIDMSKNFDPGGESAPSHYDLLSWRACSALRELCPQLKKVKEELGDQIKYLYGPTAVVWEMSVRNGDQALVIEAYRKSNSEVNILQQEVESIILDEEDSTIEVKVFSGSSLTPYRAMFQMVEGAAKGSFPISFLKDNRFAEGEEMAHVTQFIHKTLDFLEVLSSQQENVGWKKIA